MIREEVLGELGLLPLYRRRLSGLPAATGTADAIDPAIATEPDHEPEPGVAGMDWQALQAAMEGCPVCARYAPDVPVVAGSGAMPADCLVVGLAPSPAGTPYAGQAGKLLENMLAAIGVRVQNQAYVTTLLKRAVNEAPDADWLAHSEAYLAQQLTLVAPRAMLVMGERPAHILLGSSAPLAQLRGQQHQYQGVPLIVTHDPAYLLKHGNAKAEAWADLCRFQQALAQSG